MVSERTPLLAAGRSRLASNSALACGFVVTACVVGVVCLAGYQRSSLGVKSTGTERARLFNACKASLPPQWGTDAVISEEHKIIYVDNVKAASSTIRDALRKVQRFPTVNAWCQQNVNENSDVSARGVFNHSAIDSHACITGTGPSAGCPVPQGRVTTACLRKGAHLNDFFKFSFVRDPVDKFESGVRQAWFQNPSLEKLTADELLDLQLSKQDGPLVHFVNEHLQPSSFRFSGVVGEHGETLDFDFIGSTETFAQDWVEVVRRLEIDHGIQKNILRDAARDKENTRTDVDGRSKLSPDGVKKMCASASYGREWECFGYEKPAVCQGL